MGRKEKGWLKDGKSQTLGKSTKLADQEQERFKSTCFALFKNALLQTARWLFVELIVYNIS